MKRVITVGVCVAILSSCATDGKVSKQDIGIGAGAIIGGLAGSLFGKGSGQVVAILAGAAVGGLIGNQIGAMLDDEDQKALQAQAKQALLTRSDDSQVNWTSERSGATATVVPVNTRIETREVKVVRDANVVPAPQLDLIGARYVVKSGSNVRLAPSTEAAVATTLAEGSTIWAVGKVTNQPWILVARNGKSIGYMSAALVAPVPKPAEIAATPSGVVPTNASTPGPTPPSEQPVQAQQSAAAFDLDAAAPVRTPADLDALAPTEKADIVVASVTCRDIQTTATAKGETVTSSQTACKSPDGSWELN